MYIMYVMYGIFRCFVMNFQLLSFLHKNVKCLFVVCLGPKTKREDASDRYFTGSE